MAEKIYKVEVSNGTVYYTTNEPSNFRRYEFDGLSYTYEELDFTPETFCDELNNLYEYIRNLERKLNIIFKEERY